MGNFCCVQVKESTLALKENCGKFQKKLEPGCHCVPWLLGQRIAGHVSVKTKQLDIRCDTITKVYKLLYFRFSNYTRYLSIIVLRKFRIMCLWVL